MKPQFKSEIQSIAPELPRATGHGVCTSVPSGAVKAGAETSGQDANASFVASFNAMFVAARDELAAGKTAGRSVNAFYAELADMLKRRAFKYGARAEHVDEIVQEVLTNVWAAQPTLMNLEVGAAWSYFDAAVLNETKRIGKRTGRSVLVGGDLLSELVDAHSRLSDPAAIEELQADAANRRRALDRFSPEDRALLVASVEGANEPGGSWFDAKNAANKRITLAQKISDATRRKRLERFRKNYRGYTLEAWLPRDLDSWPKACQEALAQLPAVVGGAAAATVADKVTAHVDTCSACSSIRSDMIDAARAEFGPRRSSLAALPFLSLAVRRVRDGIRHVLPAASPTAIAAAAVGVGVALSVPTASPYSRPMPVNVPTRSIALDVPPAVSYAPTSLTAPRLTLATAPPKTNDTPGAPAQVGLGGWGLDGKPIDRDAMREAPLYVALPTVSGPGGTGPLLELSLDIWATLGIAPPWTPYQAKVDLSDPAHRDVLSVQKSGK